jgi:hypothetical protein
MSLFCTAEVPAITVDGTLDVGYGEAVAVQGVQTGFGDVVEGDLNGSELDAAYATFIGGRLYLMFTGNLQANFNKFEIYFDSVAGGENQLSATPQYDFSGDGGVTWNSQNQGGMTFDEGFEADYHLFSRWGGSDTPPFEADFVNRQGGTSAMVPGSAGATAAPVDLVAAGFIAAGNLGPNASGTALTQNLEFAINNTNVAGVSGCGGSGCVAADETAALAVMTGMEFSIALADLGSPAASSTIQIAAIIGNGDHNYMSNQSLGSFTPPQHNVGGQAAPDGNVGDGNNEGGFNGTLANVDFNNFPGVQFFTLTVPEAVVLPGDYNGDGWVDAADYTVWRDHLGDADESALNGNGDGENGVDAGDYTRWVDNFGTHSGGGAAIAGGGAVPEPASALFVFVGSLVAGATLRRRS